MPPFPIKSPTTGNDLPSMRKELREQLQLAIKSSFTKSANNNNNDDDNDNNDEEEEEEDDENDEIRHLRNSLEGLVSVAETNLSLLITGDKRFASTQFAFECIEKMDPQRVSVTVLPDFANTKEFDAIIIFVDSERVLEVLEETKLVVKRVGCENVFIAAFVKDESEEKAEDDGEGKMRAALESVRSSDSVAMPTKEEDEEYSDEQIDILRRAKGTKRDVEKNAATIPELNSKDAPITEFERQTLAIEPIEMTTTTTATPPTSKMNSPKQSPMKISFPSDEGNEELILRAEALLWNISLSSGIDPSNACAFEQKNIMTFHRREQIEWVKEIERALEKIEEARLRQVKSQLANVYVEASGLDAVEVGLISPEKRGKRENSV